MKQRGFRYTEEELAEMSPEYQKLYRADIAKEDAKIERELQKRAATIQLRRHSANHEIAHMLSCLYCRTGHMNPVAPIRIAPVSGRSFKSHGRHLIGSFDGGAFDSMESAFIYLCGWAWEALFGCEDVAAEDHFEAWKRLRPSSSSNDCYPGDYIKVRDRALDFVKQHREFIEFVGRWLDEDLADKRGNIHEREAKKLKAEMKAYVSQRRLVGFAVN